MDRIKWADRETIEVERGGFTWPVHVEAPYDGFDRICITCAAWLNSHHDDHGGRGHHCLGCGGGAHVGHYCYQCDDLL